MRHTNGEKMNFLFLNPHTSSSKICSISTPSQNTFYIINIQMRFSLSSKLRDVHFHLNTFCQQITKIAVIDKPIFNNCRPRAVFTPHTLGGSYDRAIESL